MNRELYQLVAISKNNIEYVVELNNDNKKNRGTLEYIDWGVTRCRDEKHLAKYLYDKGKIPNQDVKFAIKYNYNGPRYLPLIFGDKDLFFATDSILKENEQEFFSIVLRNYLKIEAELSNEQFYEYLLFTNSVNAGKDNNGDYLNEHLMNAINAYVRVYASKDFEMYENYKEKEKADYRYDIINQLYNYKQYRTLYNFYRQYMIYVDSLKREKSLEQQDIPDEISYAYKNFGMDGVYGITDLDELEERGIRFK